MQLLLLRHGMTPGNLAGLYVGSEDQPLAPEGRDLAHRVRDQLPTIEGLWVSPMLRSRQTAEIFFPGMPQHVIDDLRECNYGAFEGRSWADLEQEPLYQRWTAGEDVTPPGGENRLAFRDRGARAVRQAALEAAALGLNRIGIVSHGGIVMGAMEVYARPNKTFYAWLPKNCGGFLVDCDVNDIDFTFRVLQEL